MPTLSAPRPITFALDCPVAFKVLRKGEATIRARSGSGVEETLDFLVAKEDLYKFIKFVMGDKYVVTSGGGTVTRYIPVSHPDANSLICTAAEGVGRGGYLATPDTIPSGYPVAWMNHSFCAYRLTFTSAPYLVDGSVPFLRLDIMGTSETHTLAGSKLKFPSDNTPIQADAGVNVGTKTYAATIDLAVALDDNILDPLMGKLNNATFLGKPAGTLRFDTYQSSQGTSATFETSYTRTLFLSYRSIPWNQFLRPDYVWEAPTSPTGANVYQTADFSPLTA